MPFVVTDACVGVVDLACAVVCPVDCIYDAGDVVYIHPDECIDCTACVRVCPVDAIYDEPDLPRSMRHWAERAREFFRDNPAPVVARPSETIMEVAQWQ